MLIDISMPIESGSLFRLGSPPVEVARRRFRHESEGEYESVILTLPAHSATHVDLVRPGKRLALERMIGPGKLLEARRSRPDTIGLRELQGQGEIEAGDFVFVRTGWSRYAGSARYFDHPELDRETVEWLISKRVNAVGIDALGLGRGRRHGEYDRLLVDNDVFVIENLVGLERIGAGPFKVYCLPLRLEDSDAIPARVLVDNG